MAYDTGFTRRNNTERDLQPVAIVSVDPTTRTAVAVTRTRHTLHINTSYATGDTITTPAAGEQWYVERFDQEWRLYGRIPFNDSTLNIKAEEGQVSVGSARGPLELNGTEVRLNGKVFRLGGVYYRDNGTTLERSADQETWSPISISDTADLIPGLATALTSFQGTDPTEALQALTEWGGLVNVVADNFTQFWNEVCQNTFISGLKDLGFGDTDLSKIVSGGQNFIDYLFGILFCNFDGNLTPQTALSQLRDLLAPVINNPFIQGLQAVAEQLGLSHGNLLNDVVEGLSGFLKTIYDIITCNWSAINFGQLGNILNLAGENSPFSPATIIKSVFNLFNFLGNPLLPDGVTPNPVAQFIQSLQSFLGLVGTQTNNLLQDAISGGVEFVQTLFGVLTCDQAALTKAAALVGTATGTGAAPDNVIKLIYQVVNSLNNNQFVLGLKAFAEAMGKNVTNLFDGAVLGAIELFQALIDLVLCNLTGSRLTAVTSVIGTVTNGVFNPAAVLSQVKTIIDLITSNSVVTMLTNAATSFFGVGSGESLIKKALDGATGLFNWFFRILKTLFPFVPWSTLLPWVDWTAVNALSTNDIPVLGTALAGLSTLDIFKPLQNLVTGGTTSWQTFFSGLNGTAAQSGGLLHGIVTNITGGATGTLAALSEFFSGFVAGGGTLLQQLFKAMTGITVTNPLESIADLFDGVTFGGNSGNIITQVIDAILGDGGIDFGNNGVDVLQIVSKITGININDLPSDPLIALGNFFSGLGTGFNASTGENNLVSQIVKAITGNKTSLTDLAGFFTNVQSFFGTSVFSSLLGSSGGFDPVGALSSFVSQLSSQTNLLPILNSNGKISASILPQFSVDRIDDIRKYINGNFIQPMISTLLTRSKINLPALGIDLTKLGLDENGLTALGTWANNLVTGTTKISAENIFGTISSSLLGVIPVGHISQTTPNLLALGSFAAPSTVETADGWSWDESVNKSGVGGTAKLTITSAKNRELYSRQAVPVIPGDQLTVSSYVLTSGLSYTGGNPISLKLRYYNGKTLVSTVTPSTATTAANSNWSTNPISGTDTVPANATSVIVSLAVGSNASAGSVWFDDVVLTKPGLLKQSLVDQLIDGWNNLWNGIFNTVGGIAEYLSRGDILGALGAIGKAIADAAGTAFAGAQTAIGQIATLGGQIFDGFANFVSTGVTNLGNFIANIGTGIVDAIGSTVGGLIGGIQYIMSGGKAAENTNAQGQARPIMQGLPVLSETFPAPRTVPEMIQNLEEVVTTTYNASFSTETQYGFWNTPRDIPSWLGGQTDDVSFPQTLIDSATSVPTLGRLLLIPVKAQQNRDYDAIRFGLPATAGVFGMNNLYVGVYDVDETTGNCTKVVGNELGVNGDCRAFLDPSYDVQTIPIGTNVGGVIRSASGTGSVATLNLSTAPDPTLVGKNVVVAGMGPSAYNGVKTVTNVVNTVPSGADQHLYNTTMLLHGNGTNGSTVITDSSPTAVGMTVTGGASVSTAQFKFGTGSLLFNGSTGYVSRTAQQQMGAANFTIEGWVRPTAYPAAGKGAGIYSHQSVLNYGGWENLAHTLLLNSDGSLYYGMNSGNTSAARYGIGTAASVVPLNVWTHLAVVRNGTQITLYVNGVAKGNVTVNTVGLNAFSVGAGIELIGWYQDGAVGAYPYTGYIDEFRVTKNVARYTADFTAPTTAFSDTSNPPVYQISYSSTATGSMTTSGLITKPSPKSVQGGELYYIGVLQVGGTANGMHYWNKAGDVTTGQFPRFIGMSYDSGSAIGATAIGALPTTINNGNIVTGNKYWGSLGTYKPYVAKGSVFYSDGFNRVLGEPIGVSWTTRYGTNDSIVVANTSALASSTPYTNAYTVDNVGGGAIG